MDARCLFEKLYSCSERDSLSQASAERILKASKQYGDGLHVEVEKLLETGNIQGILVHRKCVDKYCHKKAIQKAIRERALSPSAEDLAIQSKRVRRSEQPNFSFLQHCLFCGTKCETTKDYRHPTRWRPAYVCRQGETAGDKGLKEAIYEACDKRNDTQSEQIRLRMAGVLTDLHAADVRYHVDCKARFLCKNAIQAAMHQNISKEDKETAFNLIITYLVQNKADVHNSISIYAKYVEKGGCLLSKRQLISKIVEHFGGDLITLSSPGIASILAFKSSAANVLHLVPDEEEGINEAIEKVAKQIKGEICNIETDRNNYQSHIDRNICCKFESSTLSDLLSKVSPKLKHSLPTLLIGNIVTSIVKNFATPLQIALAVQLRDSKEQVKAFCDFGVTCSYDELLRFKKSVAFAANANVDLTGLKSEVNSLIQGIGDNFDQQIHSQNGKLQTHSMALLLTQTSKLNENCKDIEEECIPRLGKSEMAMTVPYNIDICHYLSPKKLTPPDGSMDVVVPTLANLAQTAVLLNRARERDLEFFTTVQDGTPELNGYNTKLAREEGQSLKPKTKAIYLPLIDMPPAEYDTVLTSMFQMKKLCESTGQPFTLFTLDQQLYRYAVEIQWALPEVFPPSSFVLRLGGMHMLMSFIGAVGNLMTESGLADIMSSAFAGVQKMLIGKKFPMCMRALRMVVEVILDPVLKELASPNYDTFIKKLEERAQKSRTCRLWLDCLIKPVFLMMTYVRAEREGDWLLHVYCVKAMMSYFFAAGHQNYARLGLVYLRSIENLPGNVLQHFLKGKHVARHKNGLWNGIWTDMFIESTFMRYGHGRSGIVGITLKPETLKTWALSRHVCSQLMQDLTELRGESDDNQIQNYHKEEAKARMASDKNDREVLRSKIETCIHPLKPESHPEQLVNVANGTIGTSQINVDQAVSIGHSQLLDFENNLPAGFWKTIERKIKTMAVTKKGIVIGPKVLYDTQLIFSRVLGLQASSRVVDFKSVLYYELAPVPTALFNDSGEMRICTSKADLKKSTKVEVSSRNSDRIDCTILDGCAVLWCIAWPASSTTNQALVQNYVESFKQYLYRWLSFGDVYLVFDRYFEFSTKYSTRKVRGPGGCRLFQLSLNSPLPPQKQVLSVSGNKRQLIQIIVEALLTDAVVPGGFQSRLIITGQESVPIEIAPNGVVINREDLKTTHEEADTIIVAQAIYAAREERKHVVVVADDTDVYILLLYHYQVENLSIPMKLQSLQAGRAFIDISATVLELSNIVPELLPAHALTGCDTVPMCHGIGKGKMLKAVKSKQCSLSLLGEVNADINDVVRQATTFMCRCYSVSNSTTMTEARIKAWTAKTGKKLASTTPKLCSLPPTTEVFEQNVKRAHLQCAVWKRALEEPPSLDPTQYGWIKDEQTKSLQPLMIPPSRSPAPESILKLVRCSCASENPCKSNRCGCVAANLACTVFCNCQGSSVCNNEQTKEIADESDED